MNKFTQTERLQLLNILQNGKRNAINAEDIAIRLGFPTTGNQVKTRDLIRECIENGDLIASSISTPKGFYIIETIDELNDYLDSLERRASDILSRRNWLIDGWNRINLNNNTNRRSKLLP